MNIVSTSEVREQLYQTVLIDHVVMMLVISFLALGASHLIAWPIGVAMELIGVIVVVQRYLMQMDAVDRYIVKLQKYTWFNTPGM